MEIAGFTLITSEEKCAAFREAEAYQCALAESYPVWAMSRPDAEEHWYLQYLYPAQIAAMHAETPCEAGPEKVGQAGADAHV